MAPGVHPKRALYERVFNPLAVRWFEVLDAAPAKVALLEAAAGRSLEASLEGLNALCRGPVDSLLDDGMVRVAFERYGDVLWVGDEGPGPQPGLAEVRACLVAKLRRNISLGVVEAVLCLDSACHFGRDKRGLGGDELRRALRRSRGLCASLAALHDEQEAERLTFLTGREGPLEYPAVDFPAVLAGRVRIGADRFVAVPHPDGLRVRFVSRPVGRLRAGASPAMRCPAQQQRSTRSGGTVNAAVWDLLVEIFRRAGRFA